MTQKLPFKINFILKKWFVINLCMEVRLRGTFFNAHIFRELSNDTGITAQNATDIRAKVKQC